MLALVGCPVPPPTRLVNVEVGGGIFKIAEWTSRRYFEQKVFQSIAIQKPHYRWYIQFARKGTFDLNSKISYQGMTFFFQ